VEAAGGIGGMGGIGGGNSIGGNGASSGGGGVGAISGAGGASGHAADADHGAHSATGRSEFASLLVVVADLPCGGGARADAALVVAWATPEHPATVRYKLKVKPKMRFLHG
jgi:hypothetical protein